MPKLKEKYIKEVIPHMKEKFGYKNNLAIPKLEKVVVNVGFNRDISGDKNKIATIENNLARIVGQKPVRTKAKQAISAFKIRQGMVIGMMVTLRGKRMYDFVDKLINATIPCFRDFRGLSQQSVDKNGNLTIGIKEHLVFPEIKVDEVEFIHGLEVIIQTTAKTREEGYALLKGLGFPFKSDANQRE
ncbi:50S ribosomal protein L5 [Patescibacteria group bacterium]|nr:50S ribosomal protein L5 [Patescibacteria group bacterium]MBU4512663.1 50S ribosomal protein L5 [Patescibacteria group bacterium]MCG2693568.1 50S ribosomal protein L5 [Candidatus Parcubacteria bacterium]